MSNGHFKIVICVFPSDGVCDRISEVCRVVGGEPRVKVSISRGREHRYSCYKPTQYGKPFKVHKCQCKILKLCPCDIYNVDKMI